MNLEALFFGAVILFCCVVASLVIVVFIVLSFRSCIQVPPRRSPAKPPPLKTDDGICPHCPRLHKKHRSQ